MFSVRSGHHYETSLSLNSTLFIYAVNQRKSLYATDENDDTINPTEKSLCVCSLQEFVKGCGSFTKRLVDNLLDTMTAGDHSKATVQIRQVSQ